MTYSITAETLIGALTLHRDTVAGALKKARELREEGMWNIRILDDHGEPLDEAEQPRDLRH